MQIIRKIIKITFESNNKKFYLKEEHLTDFSKIFQQQCHFFIFFLSSLFCFAFESIPNESLKETYQANSEFYLRKKKSFCCYCYG